MTLKTEKTAKEIYMEWILYFLGYLLVAGIVVRIIEVDAKVTIEQSPGPLAAGLCWPIVLPIVVGMKIVDFLTQDSPE
jgi:hypothetical protein